MAIKLKVQAILAFSFVAIILSFQNCSIQSAPATFTDVNKLADETRRDGNGYGYDGKIFVLLGSLCPDKSNIQTRVVTKSATSAQLTRDNCAEIAPVALTQADFQIDANKPDELKFRNSTFLAQVPTGGTVLDLASALLTTGSQYQLNFSFGTPADNASNPTQSQVQIYENGLALGPAHAISSEIASLGLGRFSHWFDGTKESLFFSASDNSNPKTNGRVYSFKISAPALIGANFATLPKLSNPVDPRSYGAVGDGVTDNTAAFTSALNVGDILIPDGNYVVKGTVRVPSGRSIQCASLTSVKIINPVVTATGNQSTFQFWTQGGSISNCHIAGAEVFNANGSAVFDVNYQYNSLVSVVDYYGGPVGNVQIINNIFENCHGNTCLSVYGGTTNSSNNLITQNTFRNCGHHAVIIDGGTNNTVSSNHVTDCSLTVQNDNATQPNFNNIFEKNYVTTTHGTGRGTAAYITGGNANSLDYSSNIVRNNTIVGNGTASSLMLYEAAPKAAQYLENLCVMGCTVQ